MKRIQHLFEYVVLRVFAGIISLLPYRGALAVAWLAAAGAHFGLRYRVSEAHDRIQQVFKDRFSNREIRRIAWQSWRIFIFCCVDMLRRRRMTRAWVRSTMCCEDVEKLHAHLETGQGAILAMCHMGSWELAGTACQVHGLPIFQIAARQKNPYVDRYWHQLRSRGGTDDTVMRGSGAIRSVLRRLCDGQLLGILPDLRSREEGFAVPFLGGTANIGRGMGLFARRTGVPIFIGIAPRHSWTRLTFQILGSIRPDPSLDRRADAERMTREVLATIDRVIRENPEQWFWFNKRWILDPLS